MRLLIGSKYRVHHVCPGETTVPAAVGQAASGDIFALLHQPGGGLEQLISRSSSGQGKHKQAINCSLQPPNPVQLRWS